MIYYKVNKDYDNRQVTKTDGRGHTRIICFLVANELYTPAEYMRIFDGAVIRGGGIHAPADALTPINVKRNNVYWFFGARFEKGVEL